VIAVYFAVTSLTIGVLSPLWFGKWIPSVRKLRQGAKWLDPLVITAPTATPLTIQVLREHEKCGDRIVVSHHLADWTRDLQRKIFQTLGFNTVIAFVLIVFMTVKDDPTLQAPTATVWDLLSAIKVHWPFSFLLAGSLVEIVVFVKLVSDQAARYAKIIDAARPPKKSLSEQLATFKNVFRH
jgi:hypothetical protein